MPDELVAAPGAGTQLPVPNSTASAGRSTLVIGLSFLGIAVLNYAYANVMAWLLPVGSYGLLGIVQSCLNIAAVLLGSGFPLRLAQILARTHTPVEAHRAAKSALVGNLAISGFFGLLLLAAFASGRLHFGSYGIGIAALIILEVTLLAIMALWTGVLQGTLRFATLGGIRLVEVLVKVAAGIPLILLGYGVDAAIGAIVAGTVIAFSLFAWNTRRFPFWRERSWDSWGAYRDSLTIFASICALTVLGNIDIIGLQFFSTSERAGLLTGIYQAAIVLPRIPMLAASAYATALFPYLARAAERDLPHQVRAVLKYAMLWIVPMNVILLAIPEAVITSIFPASYLAGATALRIAALGSTLYVLASVGATVFQARRLAWLPALSLSIAAVVEIGALRLLVPTHATDGAALAFLIGSAVACIMLLIALMRHYPWRITVTDALRYLAAIVSLAVIPLAVSDGGKVKTVAGALLGACLYVLLLALVRLLRLSDIALLVPDLPYERIRRFARFTTGRDGSGDVTG